MRSFKARSLGTAFTTVSALALVGLPAAAHAQDAAATVGNPGPSEIQEQAPTDETQGDDIIVTGIRASLRAAIDIKRDAQGVVDAISAEDIGKFPDTNLAESLQRITGVSIDRANGEGSTVTVRGFGPEFNLVTLNGRQMPTSTLGDGASAPSSRSFDFANLASEGISAVEVYKTGRAAVPSGGIGSTINIRTPRPLDKPGTRGSIAAKGVLDTSRNVGEPITPEVSGIFSTTFGEDRFGILVSGVYQRRKASVNTASSNWRDGYLGNENNWGSLAQPGQPGSEKITNRPDPTDVYQVPQEATYALTDIDRERINGQLVLQAKVAEGLTATADYTYSSNKVAARTNSAGIWFTFGDVSSAWTDGPVAGPLFYSEAFPASAAKDLSYGGGYTANRTENKSLGGTLTWDAPGNVTMVLDAHSSSAESKPTTPYGSSVALGTAVFGVVNQRVDYDSYLPVISYSLRPGTDPLAASNVIATGNSFRNAYFKDEIDQVQLKGHYEHEGDFLKSIDFGTSYVDNRVRSAYGFIQNDTWGGVGTAADLPDDIFRTINIPDAFKGLPGANSPNIVQNILAYDFDRLVDIVVNRFGACGATNNCLSAYNTDRRINEKILAGFVQTGLRFDVGAMPVNVIGGIRYEHTSIDSRALVPIPTGTRWVSANEFAITLGSTSDFTRFKGEYDNWLPAIDVDISPLRNVKLRASYSHTITRASYADLQGGRTLEVNPRITNGFGSQGNPGLLPFKSKNIDLSAEWYYKPDSYISVGFFNKDVENFVGTNRFSTTAFDLRNPASGPRYRAAVAAVGSADNVAIRNYIFRNFPNSVRITGTDANGNIQGDILGLPEDDLYNFLITQPVNNDRTANLNGFEFAIQHSFWDTGFGTILNYTIVNGDAKYDNTLPANLTQNGVTTANAQFALTGLSDSANAVLFYDRNGIQARVAYNWRDEFLAATGVNPFYVEAYGQVDASASWEFVPGLTAFVEAINLTGESRRGHLRSRNNAAFVTPQDARYSAGLRLNF